MVQPRVGESTRPGPAPVAPGAPRKENSCNGKGIGNVLGWKEMKTQGPRVGPGLGAGGNPRRGLAESSDPTRTPMLGESGRKLNSWVFNHKVMMAPDPEQFMLKN